MARLSLDAIEALAAEALARAGAATHQAHPVARSIRRAEADDMGAVGLGFLPTYLAHLRSGKVDGNAMPSMTAPRAAVVTVDAKCGFAHPAFDAGRGAMVEAARRCGVATLAITRSYSIGVLGHPAEDLAEHGLLVVAATNAPANIAAWGGRRKLFGTNPIAFAAPRHAAPPLVADQASSKVTRVALAAAASAGRPIPADWALDPQGRPTTDAAVALTGSMSPAGGVKGANIALLVELLAAVLGGANLSMDAHPYGIAQGPAPEIGQFFMAFDPGAFAAGFAARLERLVGAIAADGAMAPGERRLKARALAAREGREVDEALLAAIASA